MIGTRDKIFGMAALLAMLFFAGIQCLSLAEHVSAEIQINQAPQVVIQKVPTDYEDSAFNFAVQAHHSRNQTSILLVLLYLVTTFSSIWILWSSLRGNILSQRNIRASWAISITLLITIPIQWHLARFTQMIEGYEKAAAQGKAVIVAVGLPLSFDLYPFLVIGLALTFSLVLRQAMQMQSELDGTV